MAQPFYSSIALEYEVPKKPMFVVDKEQWLSQSPDVNTFVSESLCEKVFSVMNGDIGLRCKTNTETAEIENEIVVSGAYHAGQREVTHQSSASCNACVEVGAIPCSVSIDFCIDKVPGTLSTSPATRLSLEDGTFHRRCTGVMNSDGSILFDYDYYHGVSSSDPTSVWAAEVSYHNFRRGGFSSLPSTQLSSFSESTPQTEEMQREGQLGFPEMFEMECMVTLIIPKREWSLVRMKQLNQVVQRSHTSSCVVTSSLDVECIVEGSDQCTQKVDRSVCVTPAERRNKRQIHRVDSLTTNDDGGIDLGCMGSCSRDAFDVGDEDIKVYEVRKSFRVMFDELHPIKRIVLKIRGSHILTAGLSSSDVSLTSLPTFSEMQESTRANFKKYLSMCETTLKLDDEAEERTQMALRYNTMRLFFLSKGINRGIPGRIFLSNEVLGASKEILLFNLGHYLYYGIFFAIAQPDGALRLLQSLYNLLERARENAKDYALRCGALYPSRTINGAECGSLGDPSIFPHVNAEIGNLIYFYCIVAPADLDTSLRLNLLEMMLETGRIWLQLGQWLADCSRFIIRASMGPDRYNRSSFSTFYVSLSAKQHLKRAVWMLEEQEKTLGVSAVDELLARISMPREELSAMKMAEKGIVLEHSPLNPGVYAVHDAFDALPLWDERRVTHPLHLNYHPLAVYRHKVVDTPDVLLGMLIHGEGFVASDYKANFEYYHPLCAFDSPESLAIVGITHARAYRNFSKPIHYYRVLSHYNLDNIMYASEEGVDYMTMVGSFLILYIGLGGISTQAGSLCVDPILPPGVSQYSLTLCWRESRLRVSIDSERILYELIEGNSVRFLHGPSLHRIYLHTGFRSFKAAVKVSIPRITFRQEGVFEGVIVQLESIVHNILEYHYVSWHRTLQRLFDTYHSLHNLSVPSLNPEEFIDKIAYVKQGNTPFSGIDEVLRSRNIILELGTPEDAEIVDTLYGLGNANLADITELYQQQHPSLNTNLFRLLESLSQNEIPLAVVSDSRHVKLLLSMFPALAKLFITSIDGDEVLGVELRGPPHPDIFLRAAQKIHVEASRCVVFSHHLDRGWDKNDLAKFFMFLDIEDPFVSSRVAPLPYPTLTPAEVVHYGRENPLICPLYLASIPHNLDELEEGIQGEK